MELLTSADAWASLLTLTALEIVLGIDNIVFISIVTNHLSEARKQPAQKLGLLIALVLRIALLFTLSWLSGLRAPLIDVSGYAMSWRDLILAGGGLFLMTKGTSEIHGAVEGRRDRGRMAASFLAAVAQIAVLDMVFSLDSVITAVGMTNHLPVMIAAVTIAVGVMMFAAAPVSGFIHRHPTTKMLALSFLLLVGVALVADALHFHIPRGYIYFAIVFSMLVEGLNLVAARRRRERGKQT